MGKLNEGEGHHLSHSVQQSTSQEVYGVLVFGIKFAMSSLVEHCQPQQPLVKVIKNILEETCY